MSRILAIYSKSREKWLSAYAQSKKLDAGISSESSRNALPAIEDGIVNKKQYLDKLGFPGFYPFTRGIHPSMYQGRLWTMRQYAGFGSAIETNKRYHYLLAQGTSGLSVAFDLPSQMGRDSDHAIAKGEVGRVGVSIDTVEDMEDLFQGIDLSKVSTSMTINSTAHILLAMYLLVAKKQNISWKKLRGTVQNDVLKEYIARGTYIYPPKSAVKISTDIVSFCADFVPQWNPISISGYHIREAGSTAVQELAFTFADAISYVESALARGLIIDDFAPRLSFFFNAHSNFLEEIAKFRAARRIWAKIVKDRFKAKDQRSMQLRFHTQTAGSTLTAQQPHVNIARTTIEALSAVLGGTQSLHTNGYDEALSLPSEEAASVALRTQQVIAYESGVVDAIDPLAGSFYVESLTDSIENQVFELLSEIDQKGGMIQAISESIPQDAIEQSAYQSQKDLEQKKRIVVGVNKFVEQDAEYSNEFSLDPKSEVEQIKKLQLYKNNRDNIVVSASLEKLKQTAVDDKNILPQVIESLEAKATLGEISDILRDVYGTYSSL